MMEGWIKGPEGGMGDEGMRVCWWQEHREGGARGEFEWKGASFSCPLLWPLERNFKWKEVRGRF